MLQPYTALETITRPLSFLSFAINIFYASFKIFATAASITAKINRINTTNSQLQNDKELLKIRANTYAMASFVFRVMIGITISAIYGLGYAAGLISSWSSIAKYVELGLKILQIPLGVSNTISYFPIASKLGAIRRQTARLKEEADQQRVIEVVLSEITAGLIQQKTILDAALDVNTRKLQLSEHSSKTSPDPKLYEKLRNNRTTLRINDAELKARVQRRFFSPSTNINWYNANELQQLLRHYCKNRNTDVITPTSICFHKESTALTSECLASHSQNPFVIPFAIDNPDDKKNNILNHWTILYFDPESKKGIYFDSYYMSQCPQFITELLLSACNQSLQKNNKEESLNIKITHFNTPIQNDGHNCGPWIVEFIRILTKQPKASTETINAELSKIDIPRARTSHAKIIQDPKPQGERSDMLPT